MFAMINCPGLMMTKMMMMTGMITMVMMMVMMVMMTNCPGLTTGMPLLPSYSLLSEVSIKHDSFSFLFLNIKLMRYRGR